MSDMTLERAKEILKPFEACKQFPIFWMEKNIDGSWSTAALLEAHSFLEGYRAGLKKAAGIVKDHYWDTASQKHGEFLVQEIEKLAEEVGK